MKRFWILVLFGVCLILICIVLLQGNTSIRKEKQEAEVRTTVESAPEQYELLAGMNSGNMAIKNSSGLFGENLFVKLSEHDYDGIYRTLNQDVLKKYGYVCDQSIFTSYWEHMADLITEDARIVLYDVLPSKIVKGGVIVTYCIAGTVSDAIDSEAYNYNSGLWLTITIYFNGNGEVISMLPCAEASIDSYANVMGFRKGATDSGIIP